MAVEYSVKHSSPIDSVMLRTLTEANDYFGAHEGMTILGEGIKEIFTDETQFNRYVEKLTEGINDATEAENLKTLMENARVQTLLESSTSGVAPVASLTLPTLRVMWAKTGLVHVVPTEPVKSNAFSVSYNKPCIVDEEGNKHYLPEALDMDSHLGDKKRLETEAITMPIKEHDLLGAVGCSKATGDSVDRNFAIASATIGGVEYRIGVKDGKLDINDRLFVEVKDDKGEVLDIIYGNVDLWNGVMNAVSMNGTVTDRKSVV